MRLCCTGFASVAARASGTCPRARAVRSVCVFAATLALCVILCGVSGSGKTVVGRKVAAQLHASFLDADDQHSQAAKAAMASGRALTDEDRAPWLERVATAIVSELQQVKYRTVLRERIRAGCSGADVRFILLAVDAATLQARLEARARAKTHFMPPSLLASQLSALEVADDVTVVQTIDGVDATASRVASVVLSR